MEESCASTWPGDDLGAPVPTPVKHYPTQTCELATFKMVAYSDTPQMKAIYTYIIHILYFPICDFPSLKYDVILFFISIT